MKARKATDYAGTCMVKAKNDPRGTQSLWQQDNTGRGKRIRLITSCSHRTMEFPKTNCTKVANL